MAYNTKNIIRDASGAPVPQYYNPATDAYEPLQGAANAHRVLLYDINGNPILTAANPGVVKVSDGADQLAVNADGSVNARLTGTYAAIDSAPVIGSKTVTTTAAEVFAGSSRLAGRYAMIVYNESPVVVYWGPSGVTVSTGFPLLPQDTVIFRFNPTVATAIYFIASNNASVRVVELA